MEEYAKQYFNKTYNFKIEDDKLIKIMNNLQNNKSPGYNGISNEMIKYGLSPKFISILKLLYEIIINYDLMPRNFNIGMVKLLVKEKRKDCNDFSNLRPLNLEEFSNYFGKFFT